MDMRQAFRTAIRNLMVNKARLAQILISLIVGTAAVVVVLNTGRLMLKSIDDGWSEETIRQINVQISTRVALNKQPSIEDLEKIAADNPELIAWVSPYVTGSSDSYGVAKYGDEICQESYFIGVNENYHGEEVVEGRWFQHMDCAREQKVCVVSDDIANDFMGGDALGKMLKIGGSEYQVIGIMAPDGVDQYFYGLIYLPYTCAQKIVGRQTHTGYQYEQYYVNNFVVCANGEDYTGEVTQILRSGMEELLGSPKGGAWEGVWYMSCTSYGNIKDQIKSGAVGMSLQYMFMAGVVLIVGGVGIMNVMLASVKERTKEIGIRKACGATNKDIKRQFMLEAVIPCLVGGLLGIVLGITASFYLPSLIGDMSVGSSGMSYPTDSFNINLTVWPILAALGASVGVGVIFGAAPAAEAAKMQPVEAINSD